MTRLVIKQWKADTRPIDSDNNYVSISGREGGLISWVLSLLGVDATTHLRVGIQRIEFLSSSLAGRATNLVPLESISSTYFGYHKPWKAALAIFFLIFFFGTSIASSPFGRSIGDQLAVILVVMAVGAIAAIVYYYLNRLLTLGFIESSGVIHAIRFKRSVIENIEIDETQSQNVCMIIQRLIESKKK
jgi:hypothetical protein